MINQKENDKYKFIYQNGKTITTVIEEDNRIELEKCILTFKEFKELSEKVLQGL